MKKFPLLTAAVLSFLLWQVLPAETGGAEVELMVEDEEIRPSTTLEFRFSRAMIDADAVGPTLEPPVVIAPEWPGTFTWLSTRSGVYVPDSAPPLGTEFVITLRKDLADAHGNAIGRGFEQRLRTPSFGGMAPRRTEDAEARISALEEVQLIFNRKVDITNAEELFYFENNAGERVAASVRHGTTRDYFPQSDGAGDWELRWELARAAIPEDAVQDADGSDWENPSPRHDRLVITPVAALTTAGVWRLEMKAGLPAMDGKGAVDGPMSVVLGAVNPFTITKSFPSNHVNSGRSATLEFSDGLAPDIDNNNAGEFFEIDPAVENLRFEQNYSQLVVRGDFALDREYRIRATKDVVSREGQALDGEREVVVTFEPVRPRVYLPLVTGHQIRGGLRKFHLSTVNVASARVKAHLVPQDQITAALEAFDAYRKTDWDENAPHEKFQPLPMDAFKSELLSETTLAFDQPVDSRQDVALDWDALLRDQSAGAVFVTVEGEPPASIGGPRPAAQALILLTDLGVLWKKEGPALRTYAFSLASGKALEGVEMRLHGPDLTAVTDPDGTARFDFAVAPTWLTAKLGEDLQAVRLGEGARDLPVFSFGVPTYFRGWDSSESRENAQWLVFTDRPLYRPAETVRVKGYMRQIDGNAWIAGKHPATPIVLRDARWETVFEEMVETDERGAFDLEIPLPPGGAGQHSLQIGNASTFFRVAEYQPNAFAVSAESPERFSPDQPVELAVSGNYFFGAPLSDAKVLWTLQLRSGIFAPEGFDGFLFGTQSGQSSKTTTMSGEIKLGSDVSSIRPQIATPEYLPASGVWTLEVTDLNQQTVTETVEFDKDAADFYLGLESPQQWFVPAGTEIPLRVLAVQPDGKPVAGPVAVQAELIRLDHKTVRVQGAGGAITFRSETHEEPVAKFTGTTLEAERVLDKWVVKDGETARIVPDRAGSYRVQVTAQDASGRSTRTDWFFDVAGPEQTVWNYRTPSQIDLVPDKVEYQPGDTARILVKTPLEGEAILTVEQGERILRAERITLTGNAPVVEIPISVDDAPNVFVSLLLIRGLDESPRKIKVPEYRHGLVMLKVTDPAKNLRIGLEPEFPEVVPGGEVVTHITVHDGSGNAMRDAEVTLFAVDDGILAISGYQRPQPGSVFHQPRPLGVRTGLSIFELLPEDEEMLRFENKGYLIGGGGLEGPGAKLRRNFPGTAAWFPALRTDADGKVTARFTAPDALTRYRLVAVAHAGADYFGSAESAFVIRKTLMVLPAIGQVAHDGDLLVARAVVRNDTGAPGEAIVELITDALAQPQNGQVRKILLQNNEARAVDFPVKFAGTGSSEWEWHARFDAAGTITEDRVASTMVVGSPSVLLRETYLSTLTSKTNGLFDSVNPQLLEGTGTVSVALSNTRLASLRESVFHLRDYPYACGEQTISRLVPLLVWNTLKPVLPELEVDPAEESAQLIAKLFDTQTVSGGLPWWPGQPAPSLFVSSYGAVAVGMHLRNGGTAPNGWDKLTTWLSSQLRDLDSTANPHDDGDRALALYALALAGKPEPAYHERLYERRALLPAETRSILALAILESGGNENMVATLLDGKQSAPGSLSVIGGEARERAVSLLAFCRWNPESAEIAPLVMELLQSRRQGHWQTTQDNAWALLALAEMFEKVEKGGRPVKGTLVADGTAIDFHLTEEAPVLTAHYEFSPGRPLQELVVSNPAERPLFGEAQFLARPPLGTQPRQDRGFVVSRSYQKLGPDRKPVAAEDLRVGDQVVVTLRVESSRPSHFVAIDDPLPAILEAVHSDFAGGNGSQWSSSHREMRADRVVIFCDHLPKGAFTFQYQARVRSAGDVSAPSTKVEEMYRPDHFGLAESSRLTSRAE